MVKYPSYFSMKVTDEERERLARLAEAWGVTPSGAMRLLLRSALAAVDTEKVPPQEPTPRKAEKQPPIND